MTYEPSMSAVIKRAKKMLAGNGAPGPYTVILSPALARMGIEQGALPPSLNLDSPEPQHIGGATYVVQAALPSTDCFIKSASQ